MLKGRRIYLRAAELEDSRLVSAWLNDRESNENLEIIYPVSKRYADAFVLDGDEDATKKLFIIDNEDRKPIGLAVISNIKWEYRNCEAGIVIYDRNQRGKGYGKDAFQVLLDFIFDDMNMHLAYLRVLEGNKAAIHMYGSFGFEMEGLLKDRLFKSGKYCNIIVMSKINPRG